MNGSVSYRDILRHHANRMSQRQIASACGCARSTVQDVLKRACERGVTWEDVAGLSEVAAYELKRGRPRDQSSGFATIDFERVKAEMERDRTMTLTILWEEYAMLAARNDERPYGYSRFCELYAMWCDEHDVAVTRKFIPGDLGEFDWAGQKMAVTDELTGEVHDAWLFVATLPYSQKTFVGAYPSTDVETWCQASVDEFEYYGGAPRLLTIDNLKCAAAHFMFNGESRVMRSSVPRPQLVAKPAPHYIPHYILVLVGSPKSEEECHDRRKRGFSQSRVNCRGVEQGRLQGLCPWHGQGT